MVGNVFSTLETGINRTGLKILRQPSPLSDLVGLRVDPSLVQRVGFTVDGLCFLGLALLGPGPAFTQTGVTGSLLPFLLFFFQRSDLLATPPSRFAYAHETCEKGQQTSGQLQSKRFWRIFNQHCVQTSVGLRQDWTGIYSFFKPRIDSVNPPTSGGLFAETSMDPHYNGFFGFGSGLCKSL